MGRRAIRGERFGCLRDDLRGRGRSEGERYYVEKLEDYTDDVATLVRIAKSENPGLPVFVLGHSVGGVASCVYTLDHQSEIEGLICESFAYDLPVPEIALLFIKGLSYITPHTHVFPLKNEVFSRDPLVIDSMNNDPLIMGESQPAQTSKVIIDAASRLNEEFPSSNFRYLFCTARMTRRRTRAAASSFTITPAQRTKL